MSEDSGYSNGEPTATDKLIVHSRDEPQLTVYSWARNGRMNTAWPGDGKVVPVDGTEIKLRNIAFPCGSVREIYLASGARTHPHPSYEAVLFYQIDGRRVQMVNEHSSEVNPGDASLQPTGVMHCTHQLIGGLFVEFAMPAPRGSNPEATWMTAAQAETAKVAEWMDDGKLVRTTGESATAAPPDASRYTVRVFPLPGYNLIETTVPMGTVILPRSCGADQLFYLIKGRMKAALADTQDEVVTGDAMRCPAGKAYGFAALEDSVFIQTVCK